MKAVGTADMSAWGSHALSQVLPKHFHNAWAFLKVSGSTLQKLPGQATARELPAGKKQSSAR